MLLIITIKTKHNNFYFEIIQITYQQKLVKALSHYSYNDFF